MTDKATLTAMLDEVAGSEEILKQESLVLSEAEARVKTTRGKLYALRSAYQQKRREFIFGTLENYQRAMCAYCKKIRPQDQMRTSCEMGYYMDSDCRYNRWNVGYKNFFPVCMLCVGGMEFHTREEEGYTVGKELLQFDPEIHKKWITWGSDNLEAAARALHIELPAI